MAHLELSVSEPHLMRQRAESSLDRWVTAVAGAPEPCLVLSAEGVVLAISASFMRMLGHTDSVVGRDVLDGVLGLLDFADGGVLGEDEVSKIPPILALTSGRLARGLLRVGSADVACTLDAVATPLVAGDKPVGSLTFFSRV